MSMLLSEMAMSSGELPATVSWLCVRRRDRASTAAPRCRRRRTTWLAQPWTATCSAVQPSGVALFTSQPDNTHNASDG